MWYTIQIDAIHQAIFFFFTNCKRKLNKLLYPWDKNLQIIQKQSLSSFCGGIFLKFLSSKRVLWSFSTKIEQNIAVPERIKKNISKSSKFTIFDNAKTSAKIISFEYFDEVKRNLSLNSAF